jgi:hypothetical protein
MDFQKAMKTKDIKYLLANSNDKIQCFDCNLIEGNSNDFYNSTFIFNNHLDKLMHINDLQDNEFTTYEQDGEMIVTYSITAKFAEEGGYNLFFIFNVTETGYKFKGMTLT